MSIVEFDDGWVCAWRSSNKPYLIPYYFPINAINLSKLRESYQRLANILSAMIEENFFDNFFVFHFYLTLMLAERYSSCPLLYDGLQ